MFNSIVESLLSKAIQNIPLRLLMVVELIAVKILENADLAALDLTFYDTNFIDVKQ